MQEHIFFSIPELSNGLGVEMNGVLLPAPDTEYEGFDKLISEEGYCPWILTEPQFSDTFVLKSGVRVMDVLQAAGRPGRWPDDMGGGVWYLNTRLETAFLLAYQSHLTFSYDPATGAFTCPDDLEILGEVFGLSAEITKDDVVALYKSGDLERYFRFTAGIPDDLVTPFTFIREFEDWDDELSVYLEAGGNLPPFLTPAVDDHWGWMGTTLVHGEEVWREALNALGSAVGIYELFERNRHWINTPSGVDFTITKPMEHLFFRIASSPGEGVYMNSILLPLPGGVTDYDCYPVPWKSVDPNFAETFTLPSGENIMEILKAAAYKNPNTFDSELGGVWYLNTRLKKAFCLTNMNALPLIFEQDGKLRYPEFMESTFGKSYKTYDEVVEAFNSGQLEQDARRWMGLPKSLDLPFPLVKSLEVIDSVLYVQFEDGSGFAPYLDPEVRDHWGWMVSRGVAGEGNWRHALDTIGRAVGDPDLFEKNLPWIQQYF